MPAFLGDYDTTETVYIPFNTFDSNDPSESVTATTLLNTDCHVHKDGSTTQRSSSAGETLSLNFDGVTGNHLLALDLSDNTDAGFYANGSTYQVRIEGASVDGGNINAWIGAFSIGRMLRPTTAGRTLDVTATGAAGIDWGNVENPTTALDLSSTDIQLVDTATTATTAGLSAAAVDLILDEVNTVGAHNVTNSVGKQIREGTASLVISSGDCPTSGSHTTTAVVLKASENAVDDVYNHKRIVFTAGTNLGFDAIVSDYDGTTKICIVSPALPAACDNTTDYEIVAAIVHAETTKLGYEGGAVWIGPSGSTGTELYVDGTASNPIDDGSWANALTVASALGINVFHLLPGSSITLAATINNAEFVGIGYTIALGGQDIGGCRFSGGAISGTGTGASRVVFSSCIFTGATSLNAAVFLACNISATITFTEAATYTFDSCFSGIAGTSAPTIDFGAAVGNTSLNMRHYSGGVQIESMGDTGTDTMSLEGFGQFIEGTCTGGTVVIRGTFTTSGITNLTLSDDARIDAAQILDAVTDDATKIDASALNTASAATGSDGTGLTEAGGDGDHLTTLATAAALTTVDTVVDAVKAKTDDLTFTNANQVDANIQSINDAGVVGDGNATPWDGA